MTVMGAAGTTAAAGAATGGSIFPGIGKEFIDEMGDLAQQIIVSLDRPIVHWETTKVSKNGRITRVSRQEVTAFELLFLLLLYEVYKRRRSGGEPLAPFSLPEAIEHLVPVAAATTLTAPGTLSPLGITGPQAVVAEALKQRLPDWAAPVVDIGMTPAVVSPGPVGVTVAYAKKVWGNLSRARSKQARARWFRSNKSTMQAAGIPAPSEAELKRFLSTGDTWW